MWYCTPITNPNTQDPEVQHPGVARRKSLRGQSCWPIGTQSNTLPGRAFQMPLAEGRSPSGDNSFQCQSEAHDKSLSQKINRTGETPQVVGKMLAAQDENLSSTPSIYLNRYSSECLWAQWWGGKGMGLLGFAGQTVNSVSPSSQLGYMYTYTHNK